MATVAVVMGSESDYDVMFHAVDTLEKFGVDTDVRILSAHRSPAATGTFASEAASKGTKVIIAAAGHAAHLAGVIAAHTTLPVIGVPIGSSQLQGLDALLATVQMPSGVPVATVAIGNSGATNAALLAVQILALSDTGLAKKFAEHKAQLAESVKKRQEKLDARRGQ